MRGFADLSLRWKIPLRVMAAVLGTAVAVTTALLVRDYEDIRQSLETHAKSIGRVLASTLVAPVLHDDLWRTFEILQLAGEAHPASAELQAEIMMVLDSERRIFVSTRPREFPVGKRPEDLGGGLGALADSIAWREGVRQQVLEPTGAAHYFVVSPLVADGELLGHVVLGYAKAAFRPRYFDLVGRAAAVTLLVLMIILPVSWVWARRTGAPLLELSEALSSLPDDLDTARRAKLPVSRDEIGQLADAFRRMIAELEAKKELESQVMVSERLAAVGRLSAGIAHEINNPLGGMLTAIKTYQRHGGADPMADQTLSLLERGISQIRNTVSALLVETKPTDRPLSPADINDLLILAEPAAQAKSISIAVQSQLSAPVPLPATLLRQIILNLLLNAIAAAADDGRVSLDLAVGDGMVRVTVGNDGKHIPEERMDYIFEPFTTDRDKGHGLGLWIVYQIVQQLKGSIVVESQPGWTNFIIEVFHVRLAEEPAQAVPDRG
jgi:signal transduction histidine kinase